MNTLKRAGLLLPLVLSAAAVGIQLMPAAAERLQFDRDRILGGELLRLVSGHFTHFTWDHLRWDTIVFSVLGSLCVTLGLRRFLACVGLSAIAISLSLLMLQPELATYRGLSGLDSALFFLLASQLITRSDPGKTEKLALTLAVGAFAGKLLYELITGTALFVASSDAFVPVPLAHFVGAVVGAVVGSMRANPRQASSRFTETGGRAILTG